MDGIDYQASTAFLAAFFGPVTNHAVEIRALPQEQGNGPARPRFTRDAQIIRDHLERWDQPGRAVYFGVATRLTGKPTGRRADLAELPALWVDIDCDKQGIARDDAVAAALSLPLRPSLLVNSGGGIHCYWLLAQAIDVSCDTPIPPELRDEDIIAVLKQLAGVLAGDPAVCDLARIMRLPGTHNSKTSELRPCHLIDRSSFELRYEFNDIVEMLDIQRPLLVAKNETGSINNKPGSIVDGSDPFLALARLAFKSVDVEARLHAMTYLASGDAGIHATQLSVTASLAGRGASVEEIVEVVLASTQIAAGPAGVAWNWKREEKAIADMARSAVAKFAPREKPTGAAAEAQEKVVRLHPRAQAKPDEETSPDAIVRNDRGNAQILVEEHGHDMRYVIGMGWHVWDGKRYRHDPENVEIGRLAHLVHQKLLAGASNDKALKWAIQAGNSSRLKNMTHEARPYVSCASEDLNADPFLLNCGNGTLDLRSSLLREHRQSDLITKLVPTSYDPGALCPTWDAFLLSIFGGDTDLVDFLQRIVGYSMTADCREQVIFILFGLGSNGKSVLIEVLSFLLADYVKHSPSDTFAAKKYGGGIPNDLAGFAGARLVSVIETEQGHGLAEGLVKQATGGDKMAVRFLHKEFFDLVPKFKLWLATNHKPVIKGSDLAIWRRIRLLPFNETFVDADKASDGQKIKDPDLKAKLLVELPGILAWATRGCRAWFERGLRVPMAVEKATRLYQESQNPIAKFVAEACWVDPSCHCEATTLYAAYQNWCVEEDEEPVSKKRFGMTLEENGFAPIRAGTGKRLRKGIDITSETREAMAAAEGES